MELAEPVKMNIYQGYKYKKDLSSLNFDNEQKFQERQQRKDQQSYISILVAYQQFQAETRSTFPDMTTVFHAWPYDRFIETLSNPRRKKL